MPRRGVGQQVAGQLLARELVEGLVFVERTNDPVAKRVNVHRRVAVVAHRIRIADQIEPMDRHSLAVVRRPEKLVQQLFVGLGGVVLGESIDDVRRRGKSGEVEAQAAGQRSPVRFAGRLKPLFFKLAVDEVIDRGRAVGGLRPLRLDVGPVSLVLGALFDPLGEKILLLLAELLAREERRHHAGLIAGVDALSQLAGVRISRLDRATLQRHFSPVQPQIGLPGVAVGPVALKTVFRQDRADIAVEANGFSGERGA